MSAKIKLIKLKKRRTGSLSHRQWKRLRLAPKSTISNRSNSGKNPRRKKLFKLSRTTKPVIQSIKSSEKSRWKSLGRSGSSQNGGLLSRNISKATTAQKIKNLTSYSKKKLTSKMQSWVSKKRVIVSSSNSCSTRVNSWLVCLQLVANSLRAQWKSNTS